MNEVEIREIMSLLPHRYPFLLIDRVLDFVSGERLTAIKNVSINEPMFTGHFPVAPIFPGVLTIEALAQATGILSLKTFDEYQDDKSLFYLAGIDNARFKRPVTPGDKMVLKVELTARKRTLWKVKGEALVEDELAASADLMCFHNKI